MSEPFITVLIYTYNHQPFIEQAVHGVLAQGYSASNLCSKHFESQIRVLQKQNGGQASQANYAIPRAAPTSQHSWAVTILSAAESLSATWCSEHMPDRKVIARAPSVKCSVILKPRRCLSFSFQRLQSPYHQWERRIVSSGSGSRAL
jgi:cellulose synthase/poly-beta-1,6-N-acetylglucosamine synthase-like glycosyltransferase